MMAEPSAEPPVTARVALAHAALQHVADRNGLDVLHIKGPALDPSIVRPERTSTDADLLVRPSHLRAYLTALRTAGWHQLEHFRSSSSFEHSAAFRHAQWGLADVHRHIPGFTVPPEDAFERLWADRGTIEIASWACAVPSVPAQVLVLVLHAARSGGTSRARADVNGSWDEATPALRDEVLALVAELQAEVAFSVITGTLEEHRKDRHYLLWRVVSQGGTRAQEWRARIAAAPTLQRKVLLLLRAPLVNVDHLRMERGGPVTWREVLVEFFARPARAVSEYVRPRGAGQ